MDREQMLKEFDKYIKDKNIEIESEEDLEKHIQAFFATQNFKEKMLGYEHIEEDEAEDVYDYLELAESAPSKKEALKYAKKALAMEPENWDAASMVAQISSNTPETLLDKLKKLIEQANDVMKRDGWFSEQYIGDFWGFYETRPYMRLRNVYLDILVECSMYKKAIEECKEIIRLNDNDNMGVRYKLMHLYTYFEDEESALKLSKKYKEDYSSMFLLPLSMLYYKLGDLKSSTKYLKLLKEKNKDTLKFFEAFVHEDAGTIIEDVPAFGYQPFTIQEFAVEMEENQYLFAIMAPFFVWGLKKLKSSKK